MPDEGVLSIEDLVHGHVEWQASTIEDQVILKSDGFPTYHLAVVVDDHVMDITHIMRGEEWVASVPKHLLIYRAFGWDVPPMAHFPSVLGPDGKRLSKRHGSTAVSQFRDDLIETQPAPIAETNLLEARARADQCVERLKQNPNDVAARERFAILLAEQLGKADLAIEQLDLLLAKPDQPEPKSAEWLALTAAWQMRYRQNPGAARIRLQRLIQLHPQTPQAFAAQRQLGLMDIEERFRKARSAR